MTGSENLRLVARLFGLSRRDAAAARRGCSNDSTSADAGDRLVRTYSGGMRRRLDLGASLVGRAAAPAARRADHRARSAWPHRPVERDPRAWSADGTDVLLTTQYLEEADQLARHIVIVDHGRVITAGTPDELKDQAGRNVIEVRPRLGRRPARRSRRRSPGSAAKRRTPTSTRSASPPASTAAATSSATSCACSTSATSRSTTSACAVPSLDEVFLAVTGKHLGPTDPDTDPQSAAGRRRLISGAPMTTTDTRTADRTAEATLPRATGADFVTAVAPERQADDPPVLPHAAAAHVGHGAGRAVPVHVPLHLRRRDPARQAGSTTSTSSSPASSSPGSSGSGWRRASGVAEDATTGVHDRLRSLPIPAIVGDVRTFARRHRRSRCGGCSSPPCSRSSWGSGSRPMLSTSLLALGLLVVVGVHASRGSSSRIGLVSSSAQAANGMATLLVIPVSFISAAYVPADSLPGWLQPVADNQPFTIFSNALRSLTLGGPRPVGLGHTTTYWVVLSLVWCAGIFLVFSTIAVSRFSRRR